MPILLVCTFYPDLDDLRDQIESDTPPVLLFQFLAWLVFCVGHTLG